MYRTQAGEEGATRRAPQQLSESWPITQWREL